MDRIDKIARRIVASAKNVDIGEIGAFGTHILGKLVCAPDDREQVTEYEFPAVEREFQKYYNIFMTAKKSVCVKEAPVVYYSSEKGWFYSTFDFDAPKNGVFSDEERIEEIKELARGVR